jgi:hypothetical protein
MEVGNVMHGSSAQTIKKKIIEHKHVSLIVLLFYHHGIFLSEMKRMTNLEIHDSLLSLKYK